MAPTEGRPKTSSQNYLPAFALENPPEPITLTVVVVLTWLPWVVIVVVASPEMAALSPEALAPFLPVSAAP